MAAPGFKPPMSGEDYERAFKSKHWPEKIVAAGFLGIMMALRILWRKGDTFPPPIQITILTTVPAFFISAACVLARSDWVRGHVRAGEPVGRLSRVFFAAGIWSLLIWIVAVLLVGFPLAIWLGSLTSGRPAG
jgi:hypothetical protein